MLKQNYKIRSLLSIGFGIAILMTELVLFHGISSLDKINRMTSHIYNFDLNKSTLAITMIDLASKDNHIEKLLFHSYSDKELNDAVITIREDFEESKRLLNTIKNNYESDNEFEFLTNIEKSKKEYENSLNRALVIALGKNSSEETRNIIFNKSLSLLDIYKDNLSSYITFQGNEVKKTIEKSDSDYQKSFIAMIVFGIVAIFIGVACAHFLIRKIVLPVNSAVEAMEKIAVGDFSKIIDSTSISEAGRLNEAIKKVLKSLGGITIAIKRLSEGDISVKLTPLSEKDILSKSVMDVSKTIEALTTETSQLTGWVKEGKLEKRGNPEQFKGVYRKLVEGINETLDSAIKPINDATKVLEAMASKNLTTRLNGNYKGDHARIINALNTAIDNLSKSINSVSIASKEIASESSQLSSAGQVIAEGAMQQAEELEMVTKRLDEITSITGENTNYSETAKQLSISSCKSTARGKESMERLSEAVRQIKDSSDKTSRIVKTIDEIAFQTNLLALNAAVEAARAGESGRGFAVVAEEVRNLAIRSAEAAKSTAKMIEESVKKADNGVVLNKEVIANLEEVNKNVLQTGEVVENIASSCSKQNKLISEVDIAVEEINRITQKNSANSEETASSCAELSSQAREMQKMVEEFRVNEKENFVDDSSEDISHSSAA